MTRVPANPKPAEDASDEEWQAWYAGGQVGTYQAAARSYREALGLAADTPVSIAVVTHYMRSGHALRTITEVEDATEREHS